MSFRIVFYREFVSLRSDVFAEVMTMRSDVRSPLWLLPKGGIKIAAVTAPEKTTSVAAYDPYNVYARVPERPPVGTSNFKLR